MRGKLAICFYVSKFANANINKSIIFESLNNNNPWKYG